MKHHGFTNIHHHYTTMTKTQQHILHSISKVFKHHTSSTTVHHSKTYYVRRSFNKKVFHTLGKLNVKGRKSLLNKLSFFAFDTATDMSMKKAYARLRKTLKKHGVKSSGAARRIWKYIKGFNLKKGNGFLLKDADKSWLNAKKRV